MLYNGGVSGSDPISGLIRLLQKQIQLRGRAPSAILHKSLCEARPAARLILYFRCHREATYLDDPSARPTNQLIMLLEKKIPLCEIS